MKNTPKSDKSLFSSQKEKQSLQNSDKLAVDILQSTGDEDDAAAITSTLLASANISWPASQKQISPIKEKSSQ